jgi:hypothetical protein
MTRWRRMTTAKRKKRTRGETMRWRSTTTTTKRSSQRWWKLIQILYVERTTRSGMRRLMVIYAISPI